MNNLLILFSNNILPIFLAAGCGYLISRFLKVPPKPISQVTFYIFSPCLIFSLLTKSQLGGDDIARMVAFTVILMTGLGLIAWLVGRTLRFDRLLLVAVVLTTMFANSGNYGLSLTLFAFGEGALAHASLFFVTQAILVQTVGVVIVSLGSLSLKQAIISVFKVPGLYAVTLALVVNYMNWQLPLFADRTISLLGDAAIPVLMVLMGIQLGYSSINGNPRALVTSNVLRLIISPALAIGLSVVFGLTGVARQAGIIEAAMPTAVLTTVLATQYNVKPSFVSTVVFTTTLLSPFTVTPLLAYLGA
ncbi:MAG: AEC family transporter [Anaerolineales bacterium]|nr:AEC family transporter [Anaerolineales bacterium]